MQIEALESIWRENSQKYGFSSSSDGLTVFSSRFTVDFRPEKKKKKKKRSRENLNTGWTEVRGENVSD